jgi:hypothetical protein
VRFLRTACSCWHKGLCLREPCAGWGLKDGGGISPLFHEDDQISPLFHEGDQISPLFHEGAQNFNLIILPQWVTCFLAAEARPTSGDPVLEAVIGVSRGMVGQIHVREKTR